MASLIMGIGSGLGGETGEGGFITIISNYTDGVSTCSSQFIIVNHQVSLSVSLSQSSFYEMISTDNIRKCRPNYPCVELGSLTLLLSRL